MKIFIQDTGIGISPDVLPNIFHAFEQGDGATARRYGGTGLGLKVTKALVELHEGDIQVYYHRLVEYIFSFTIPVATEEEKLSLVRENPLQEINDYTTIANEKKNVF